MGKYGKHKIKNYLIKNNKILFALFFGSVVSGKINNLSDIDIGLYFKEKIDILEIGNIVAELEKITNRNVDIVELNGLYKKKPFFTNEIIKNSELIFNRNEDIYIKFKRYTIKYYLDTQYLRETVRESFSKRIESNRLGQLNYV